MGDGLSNVGYVCGVSAIGLAIIGTTGKTHTKSRVSLGEPKYQSIPSWLSRKIAHAILEDD